ncbi:MAG TPA: hypothetical protein VKA54_22085 [Gemmatimonadaceae bacterium]|nr:hypothetical protein [Gemmatimonadaceae bacterium]
MRWSEVARGALLLLPLLVEDPLAPAPLVLLPEVPEVPEVPLAPLAVPAVS